MRAREYIFWAHLEPLGARETRCSVISSKPVFFFIKEQTKVVFFSLFIYYDSVKACRHRRPRFVVVQGNLQTIKQ